MHDCPQCSVPLHGYEEVCPRCGARQRVRKSYSNLLGKNNMKPGFNPLPILVVIVLLGVAGFSLAQTSWIGQLMRRGPAQVDPMDQITQAQARQLIFQKINEGLTACGATGQFKWEAGGTETDINSAGPVELTVNTKLADPNSRRQIIDPIKELMHKAQIPTLVMNDEKSHATWTYTVQAPLNENKEDDNPLASRYKRDGRDLGQTAAQAPQQQYQAPPQQQQYQQAAPQEQYQQPAQQQAPPQQQQAPAQAGGSGSIDQIYNEEKNGDYSQYKNQE